VSASGLAGCAGLAVQNATAPGTAGMGRAPVTPPRDFTFLQLSDTHWGYQGSDNPESIHTLRAAIHEINASSLKPDFVVFTGDLTHITPEVTLRRQRMKEFREIIGELDVKTRYFLPGEHDVGPDSGEVYRENFGKGYGSFDHEGIHFVMLDNVSSGGMSLGDAQLDWLDSDLRRLDARVPVVVFAHRPLFALFPSWDWMTQDGGRALELLQPHAHVTVFYGHIHQEHHFKTGHIEHHAARSLIFPLPAPGSVAAKAPLAWDPSSRDHGLGYRVLREIQRSPVIEERSLSIATLNR